MIELMPVAWLQAKMMHASTKGITYLRRNSDSLSFRPVIEVPPSSAAAISSISLSSTSACSGVRDRSSARRAASFWPRRNNHRGDSATIRLPMTKRMPGGNETQKMLRQAASLKARILSASASFDTCSTRKLKNIPMSAAATMPRVKSH